MTATKQERIYDILGIDEGAEGAQPSDYQIAGKALGEGELDAAEVMNLPLADVAPDPEQARDEGADEDLAGSIAAQGVLQPIRVYRHPDPASAFLWMIDDGERRYRGALKAGLTQIPAREVKPPAHAGEKLLRQNLLNDGKRLKPMEEARSWKKIMDAYGWKLQQLADALGRAKSTVSDRLALLDAPAPFQSLFADGTLTPAAAPIVREYREVPERLLKEAVKRALEDQWREPIEQGVPVSLDLVKSELEYQLIGGDDSGLFSLTGNKDVARQYGDGPSCTIRGVRFATDLEAIDKIVNVRREAADAHQPAPRREPSSYEKAERERAKKARAESEKRQSMIRAMAAKLPTSLNAEWSLFLVRHIVDEMTSDSLRHACHAIGITPPKMGKLGFQFDKAIIAHATATKAAGDRVRIALQLLMAADCYVSPHSSVPATRIAEAARLAKVDLKKLAAEAKPDVEISPRVKKALAKARAKTAASAKRRPFAQFMRPMQLSPALAAVVGAGPMPRTDITNKLWKHIKKHGLEDTKERRMINADEKLSAVFGGKKRVSMFEMTKLINKHLKPTKD